MASQHELERPKVSFESVSYLGSHPVGLSEFASLLFKDRKRP
jgi:hypothetical protein